MKIDTLPFNSAVDAIFDSTLSQNMWKNIWMILKNIIIHLRIFIMLKHIK